MWTYSFSNGGLWEGKFQVFNTERHGVKFTMISRDPMTICLKGLCKVLGEQLAFLWSQQCRSIWASQSYGTMWLFGCKPTNYLKNCSGVMPCSGFPGSINGCLQSVNLGLLTRCIRAKCFQACKARQLVLWVLRTRAYECHIWAI